MILAQLAAVVLSHATLIDARSPEPMRDQTIVIRGDRIVQVGPSSSVAIPPDARVMDATGKFVIPGLWDMHTHVDVPEGRGLLAAYMVAGVTGIRDMAGHWDTLTAWRREIGAGRLVGPRIFASGPYLDGSEHPIPYILVKTPEDARRGVDSLKKLGVDVVKVHTGLTREAYLAAVVRAREVKLPIAGHVPRVVGAISASDWGIRSIEHMLTIPVPCTPAESIALAPRYTVQQVLGPCTSATLDPLLATLATNHTWVTPTYVAQVEVAWWPTRELPGDAYAQYVPMRLQRFVQEIFPMPDGIPPDADSVGRVLMDKRIALAGTMYHAGVPLLAGSDTPLRNSPPGFGLAEELRLFAQGGLSLFEVLKVATWEPASYFGILDHAGTVQAGRNADLVVLDASPLQHVYNYRRVSAVVAQGRLFTLSDLDSLRAQLIARGRRR